MSWIFPLRDLKFSWISCAVFPSTAAGAGGAGGVDSCARSSAGEAAQARQRAATKTLFMMRKEEGAQPSARGKTLESSQGSHRRPRAIYFFAALASASSIFLRYPAVSLLKSFRQDLQQNLISRPASSLTFLSL